MAKRYYIASKLYLDNFMEVGTERNLCRVENILGIYRGYRRDILTENLTERDNALLICEICKGIMREACLSRSGKQFCSCCEIKEFIPKLLDSYEPEEQKRVHQNPNIAVRKMVDSLKCSCPLSQRGCEWLGTLKDCEEHLETCGYVLDECKLGCRELLQRNELKVHEMENCPEREVSCEHCCRKLIFRELSTHLGKCPKVEVSCELCAMKMCREDMAQHLKKDCGLVVEICELGCGMKVTRDERKIHVTYSCIQRLIACEHCKMDIKFCDMPTHLDVCPKMEVSCEWNCGVTLCRDDMAQHVERDCVEKEIECPFAKYKCEMSLIKRKYFSQHLEKNRTEHLELKLNAMEQKLNEMELKQNTAERNQNRMTEHINALCSISKTTKLDWSIENISKFIEINHIPQPRAVAGHDLNIYFLKEDICAVYADTFVGYLSVKFLIRLYSTLKWKVVKEYDIGLVIVYGGHTKSRIARITKSDAEELSRTGSANKLILEMYVTMC